MTVMPLFLSAFIEGIEQDTPDHFFGIVNVINILSIPVVASHHPFEQPLELRAHNLRCRKKGVCVIL